MSMEFKLKRICDDPWPLNNYRQSPMPITSDLFGIKDIIYQSVYHTPRDVERIKNSPMTDRQRADYQREHRIRYFRKVPIFNQPPVYFDNPGINAHMDAMRPRAYEYKPEITCSRCWRVVVKHVERIRNSVVVSLRKVVNY